MRIFLTCIFLIVFTNPAWAFHCPESSKVERAFLIYVTETKLDEKLWKEMNKGYPAENDESVKAIFAEYRIIEEFLGDPSYKPRLYELLGISVGYVGLIPGNYYFVGLGPVDEENENFPNVRNVNICNTPFQHYRLDAKPFQDHLNPIRKERDSLKEKEGYNQ